jgi:hypothetical protein
VASDLSSRNNDILEEEKNLRKEIEEMRTDPTKSFDLFQKEQDLAKLQKEKATLGVFIQSQGLEGQFGKAQAFDALSDTEKIIEKYTVEMEQEKLKTENAILEQQKIIDANTIGIELLKTKEKELADLKDFYTNQSEERALLSYARQKTAIEELVATIKTAQMEQIRLNELQSRSASVVNNSKTVNVNQNINSRSDADYFVQATKQL